MCRPTEWRSEIDSCWYIGSDGTDDPLWVFKLGIKAGIVGADPRECPFPKMSKEHNEWQRGLCFGLGFSNVFTTDDTGTATNTAFQIQTPAG
jgi:hypothetical protein